MRKTRTCLKPDELDRLYDLFDARYKMLREAEKVSYMAIGNKFGISSSAVSKRYNEWLEATQNNKAQQ